MVQIVIASSYCIISRCTSYINQACACLLAKEEGTSPASAGSQETAACRVRAVKLRAHGNVVLVEGLEDEARQDLAHAEARLAQPHVPPHDLRVAALLPQLRELPQQLAAKPASKTEQSSA